MMIEQKPVAQCYINFDGECEQIDWLGTINAIVYNEFTSLFTAEQLKAEREMAAREALLKCAEICESVTNKSKEIAKRCNHGNDNDWWFDAQPWMESAALNASDDCKEEILTLLSTHTHKSDNF